ncbi:NFACT family protein [Candidatus Woesearchaeota archaeon]|nr:NFACT family protein [Candidatus Woesearchaeota archaeon]
MKKELTSIELSYVVKELQFLVGGKIDKIYQPEKKELVLRFHVTSKGKQILRILPGKYLYLTEHKRKMPETALGYCLYLRKYLGNARLREVRQIGFERIVEFVFEKKEGKLSLFVELFGKGNIILCKEGIIMSPLETQKWKDRVIRAKEKYVYPKKEFNFLEMNKANLSEELKKSKEESLVKMLALDLGLGGVYSEELCLNSGIDKNKTPNKVSSKEIDLLFNEIKKLRAKKPSPKIVYDNSKIVNIVPFELNFYKDNKTEKTANYNNALDSVLTEETVKTEKLEIEKVQQKSLLKIQKIIDLQTKKLQEMEKKAEENQRKGELVYEKYQLIKEILEELQKARKKLSWKEIKQKLKGHKIIKEINEKTGEIVVEV